MTLSTMVFLRALMFLVVAISIDATQMRRLKHLEKSDLVVGLPGQPQVKFRHYAGDMSISEHKSLFYWFFEAMEEPTTKPLILWLNGGPGCSSISIGALTEIGPFLVTNSGSSLKFNPYAWNKVANLLFLDSPVGVGFSYSNSSSDMNNLNDETTADDTYTFLTKWFQEFPYLKSREFYITGESYAGHYVPQLADVIHERNKEEKNSYINLKGIMIGNPLIDEEDELNLASIDFAWNQGFISDKLYQAATAACKPIPSSNCSDFLYAVVYSYSDIMHNIYSPKCSKSNTLKREIGSGLGTESTAYDPCAVDNAVVYLSREEVQEALHANLTRLPYPYSHCRMKVFESYNETVPTVFPWLRKLMDVGYRVWIYSGDTDGRISIPTLRRSINKMNLTEKTWDKWGGWKRWYHEGQVAGWMVEYEEGLTFITVRGAGHMVPSFAPRRALKLISNFLTGETLPLKHTKMNNRSPLAVHRVRDNTLPGCRYYFDIDPSCPWPFYVFYDLLNPYPAYHRHHTIFPNL